MVDRESSPEPTPEPAAAPPEGHDRIAHLLRRAFDEAASEPLPEALEALLRRLD